MGNAKRFSVFFRLLTLMNFFWIPKKYQSSVAFYIHEKNSSGVLSQLGSHLGALGGFFRTGPGIRRWTGGKRIIGGACKDGCYDIVMNKMLVNSIGASPRNPLS
ncbi:MAG: hypothetical protein PVH64_00145 [Bacillota bacterium]|jgi:hypothetical protein